MRLRAARQQRRTDDRSAESGAQRRPASDEHLHDQNARPNAKRERALRGVATAGSQRHRLHRYFFTVQRRVGQFRLVQTERGLMHILTARVILEEEGPRPQIACGAWSAGALIFMDDRTSRNRVAHNGHVARRAAHCRKRLCAYASIPPGTGRVARTPRTTRTARPERCPAPHLCRARTHASAHARDALQALCSSLGMAWSAWKSPLT